MKKYIYWLLPLLWMGVIFYSSSQPYENQDMRPLLADGMNLSSIEPLVNWISFTYNGSAVSVETHGVAGFIEFFIRKGAHVAVFFLLACFFFIALRKSTELQFKYAVAISFFATVAYAIADEVHQGFTPNRTPYVGDVVLDALGAFAAVIMLTSIYYWKKRSS
ncbi:VanZ family protein [Virgibacillus kimchii]